MKKLRLEMDDLQVESFDTWDVAERGTVRGQQASHLDYPCGGTDFDQCPPSYEVPCWWTGHPMQDCYAPSELNVCTDYPAYC